MTESQRDEILIQLVNSTNSLNNKLDKNIEFTKQIDNKLNENIKFTKQLDNKLNENIEFTKRINNSVIVIEEEHGNKLKALFDGYTTNSDKLDNIQNDIKNIHSILNKHDDQIYLLKSN